ncbi:heat shock 70 kDa protein 12B [Pyxicephalus adspersus]|uniref:heat shock 70 kDa protein 12B n=1 Tax=Pyxicephalus adspersus TaxID=30357 RepID=UPI003B5AB6CB
MTTIMDNRMQTLQIESTMDRSYTPSPPGSPSLHNDSCNIAPLTPSQSPRSEHLAVRTPQFFVVVAIDFGTTSSGYAFSFCKDPEAIHMMSLVMVTSGASDLSRLCLPQILLCIHTYGLYPWLNPRTSTTAAQMVNVKPFPKLSMGLQQKKFMDLTMKTELEAVNGKKVQALEVFAHALRFFKEHAVKELRDQCLSLNEKEAIRWVITVPAIWKQPAKQFMREAAYLADLVSPENPEQLLIALEPEAASIYCRKLRIHQMIDLSSKSFFNGLPPDRTRSIDSSFRIAREQLRRSRHSRTFLVETGMGELWSEMQAGDRYIVADCGGGTMDLTVHQIEQSQGTLKELYKASGGPYGSVGVDLAFEQMLCKIFSEDFIQTFKVKRPAAWVDLMIAFEARKRTAAPQRSNHLNISLPFSFIDFYRRHKGHNVETALRKSSVNFVKWSSQGMLRMSSEAMNELFQPTVQQIVQHIGDLMNKPEVKGIKYLFLVGGFAESPMLQNAVQSAFSEICRVIIPQDVGLTILKGAVLFGLDPTIVRVRRSPLTYGVGVLNKFVEGKHPKEKLLVKDGKNWCTDIFDKFVSVDQSVALGDIVQRSYCPARLGQRKIIINIYCTSTDDVVYITDPGVRKCGTINLDLPDINDGKTFRREIKASMQFGDTEIKVTAMDVKTSKVVRASIDFLSN